MASTPAKKPAKKTAKKATKVAKRAAKPALLSVGNPRSRRPTVTRRAGLIAARPAEGVFSCSHRRHNVASATLHDMQLDRPRDVFEVAAKLAEEQVNRTIEEVAPRLLTARQVRDPQLVDLARTRAVHVAHRREPRGVGSRPTRHNWRNLLAVERVIGQHPGRDGGDRGRSGTCPCSADLRERRDETRPDGPLLQEALSTPNC